jgi:hypothetical protein
MVGHSPFNRINNEVCLVRVCYFSENVEIGPQRHTFILILVFKRSMCRIGTCWMISRLILVNFMLCWPNLFEFSTSDTISCAT